MPLKFSAGSFVMKKYILFLKEHILAPLTVSLWLAVVVGCVVFFSELEIDPLMDTPLNQADLCLFGSVLFSGFTLFYFLVQAFLAVFYRPYPELAEKDLPFVTVIIPAYNEGMQIASTVESVMKADYPAGKFENDVRLNLSYFLPDKLVLLTL